MIDLSTTDEEKSRYVMGLLINDDCTEYTVTYADGHKENFPFTIHNYNAEIYRMIAKFKQCKAEIVKESSELIAKSLIKEVKSVLLSLVGLVLTVSIPMPNVMRIILVLLNVLYGLFNIVGHHATIKFFSKALHDLEAMEYCYDMLDEFKVEVIDPHNGSKEEWFLVNPTNIENPILLKLFALSLTPEIKEEEGKNISEAFKYAYEKKIAKAGESPKR